VCAKKEHENLIPSPLSLILFAKERRTSRVGPRDWKRLALFQSCFISQPLSRRRHEFLPDKPSFRLREVPPSPL